MTENKENNNSQDIKDEWLMRKCMVYDEEYKDCTSIRARFHQLFIYGKTVDCGQWKRDSVNCYKWIDDKDVNAANELVQSEKQKRKERLSAHYQNNVWAKRKSPPDNWNTPLPEDMQKEYENTYLHVKAREMRGEIPPGFDPPFSLCTLL